MGAHKREDADCHFLASACAAIMNFPLWKVSAIKQSGFKLQGDSTIAKYRQALRPPYKGMFATIAGMTWARAAIFYGSDEGKRLLTRMGAGPAVATVAPPLILSTMVQFVNMPIVRASVTIQNPANTTPNIVTALVDTYNRRGFFALWHGLSAGIMKTVPKYITAVVVKDVMEEVLPRPEPSDRKANVLRAAIKSTLAGVAGATLTNPLDVLRNEMFKTDLGVRDTLRKLRQEHGWAFAKRGMTNNVIAVAVPVSLTIFLTDIFIAIKRS